MRIKMAFCLCLLTLPLLVGCSAEPKEEPTPAPPPTSALGAPMGNVPQQQGTKGMVPQ